MLLIAGTVIAAQMCVQNVVEKLYREVVLGATQLAVDPIRLQVGQIWLSAKL